MTAQVQEEPTLGPNATRFGNYHNADLTTAEYDMMFIQSHIDEKYLAKEADLMKSKWFDYRFMHFVEATYLFSMYYTKATQYWTKKVIDMKRGDFVKGFKGGDFLKISQREKVGFWRARAHADSMGISYEFYTHFAFKWCVEGRIWKRFPRPNQLYSQELLTAMVEAWREECAGMPQIPIHENYRTDSGIDCEHTEHFQHWLCNELMKRTSPELGLNTYMNKYPHITRENAIKYMGEQIVNKVV